MRRLVPGSKLAPGDLIWLIAAAALAMCFFRVTVASVDGGYMRHTSALYNYWIEPRRFNATYYLFFTIVIGVPQLFVASLIVVIFTLRTRRDSGIPLGHRPGFVLCLAAVVAGSFTFVTHGVSLILGTRLSLLNSFDLWSVVVFATLPNVGYMIFGSCMVLAMNGHRVPTASWLDRFGYALGATWVTLVALESVRYFLERCGLM